MHRLKEWRVIKLNPLVWVTIAKKHIAKFANSGYQKIIHNSNIQSPKPAEKLKYGE